MARDISLAFALGARLQSGFSAAFRSASRQAQLVSQSIREMEETPTGRIGAVMAAQRDRLKGLSERLRGAQGELARLRQQAVESGSASALLTRQIAQAERRVDGLSASLRRQGAAWRETVAQAATAGGSVRELTRNYEQLSQRLKHVRALQAGLAANRTQAEALRNQREDLQGRLVGTALTGASVALPVRLAVSAEDTFADLRKVMDAPESVMQQVFVDAQEMSNRTGKSFEDVVTIMTAAAQAGLGTTREQLLGVADQAVKMSIAWGVSAEQAGKSLATWQASMGMTAEQSKHTADVINALSNNMNATAGELNTVFTEIGPLMKATGFATQDIAALGIAFEAAGAAPDKAATAMKNFVKVMAAGDAALTDERKAIYKYLEIDPNKLQKELQTDAKSAVMRVLEALQKVRPEELNSIATLLFGDDSLMAIMPLMTQIDTLRKAFKIANGDVSGSVEQEYANRMKTTATALARLKQSTRNLGVTVGSALLPVVGAAAQSLTGIVDGARELTRRFPRLTAAVMTGAAAVASLAVGGVALGLVANVARTSLNSWRGVLLRLSSAHLTASASAGVLRVAALAGAAASRAAGLAARFLAGGLRSVLMATGVGAALVGLGFAATWVIENWDRLRIFFSALFDNLSALARPGIDAVVGCFQGAGQRVVAFWSGVRDWFGGLWQGMTELARAAWTYIADLGRWAWEGISAVWSGAGAFFSGIVDSITGIFSAFFDWLREKFSFLFSAIDSIGSAVGSVTGAVSDAWSKAFGDDAPKPAAPDAASAAASEAAKSAASAAAGKSAAPEVKEPQLATGGGKKGVDGTAYFNKSFNDFMSAEEARKKGKSGGSGGRSGSKSGRAASGNGPITVVTLAGDNSRTQTLFIPASSRGTSATPVASATTSSARLASTAVLPQTPARLARRAGNAPTGERGGSVQVAVSQKFDILSSDPRAVRKLMDSLKPDFENLVRRALEKLESNRRRTAYAQ